MWGWPRTSLDHEEWARFWKSQGQREVALILWATWDPIGAGVPADEYESYADTIGELLRARRSPNDLAAALAEIRRAWMELPPDAADIDAAYKLDEWYLTVTGELG